MDTVSYDTKTPASCAIGCAVTCGIGPIPFDVAIGIIVSYG